jgi:signal transduction histidine kinase
MQQLIDKTRRIGRGDLSQPVEVQRRDEFGELAGALNSMCDQLRQAQQRAREEMTARINTLSQLRHADRLRTVGRLAAGIAHELGTPLNVISGRANLIATRELSEQQVRDSATAIKSEADRIAAIVRQLLDFARRGSPQRQQVDMVHLVRQTVELLGPIGQKTGCRVRIGEAPESCPLAVDSHQIQQVLTNLIMNAIESMPQGGDVDVRLAPTELPPPDSPSAEPAPWLRISVRDQGPGIAPDAREQIFEPFFTTKDVGEGTGLGLSIAFGIVQDHEGWIDVSSQEGQGSCFSVLLPRSPAACKAES